MPPTNRDVPDLTRLRQAVDASGEVIFMTDREGVFTFVNPQFERLYGCPASEVVGRATPRVLKGGGGLPEHYTALWQRLVEGQSVESGFVNRTKDGRFVDIEATVSPIWDEGKSIVGFLWMDLEVMFRISRRRHFPRHAQAARQAWTSACRTDRRAGSASCNRCRRCRTTTQAGRPAR
jgi:PAS domain S-box-containing protein